MIACFKGYEECVDGAIEKGILIASNVYETGTVASTSKMEEAYVMGKNVQVRIYFWIFSMNITFFL